jgi:hypothetical protein
MHAAEENTITLLSPATTKNILLTEKKTSPNNLYIHKYGGSMIQGISIFFGLFLKEKRQTFCMKHHLSSLDPPDRRQYINNKHHAWYTTAAEARKEC